MTQSELHCVFTNYEVLCTSSYVLLYEYNNIYARMNQFTEQCVHSTTTSGNYIFIIDKRHM